MGKKISVAIGSFVIMFVAGSLYSLSVFNPSLLYSGFTMTDLSLYSMMSIVFGFIFSLISSIKLLFIFDLKKLTACGGLLTGGSFLLFGLFNSPSIPVLLLSGLLFGAGVGMTWVVPFSISMRWFPNRIGLTAGLLVFSQALGSFFWVKLAGPWGNLLTNYDIYTTFIIYGILFFILTGISSFTMVNPPDEIKTKKDTVHVAKILENSLKLTQVLRTRNFYLMVLALTLSSGAGILSVSIINIHIVESQQLSGIDADKAYLIAGTALAVLFGLSNGLGRIIWGLVSDYFSRGKIIILVSIFQAIIIIALYFFSQSEILLYILISFYGLNFGGVLSLFTAFTGDTFGIKFIAQNFIIVMFSYQVLTGLFGLFGHFLADSHQFMPVFIVSSICCLIAIPLVYMIKELPSGQPVE